MPPTVTPITTNTPGGPTPTDCPNVFVDVNGNVFYYAIHYLNCRSVINGTDATHYSPAGTSTRGQFAKVVVLGFGTTFYTPTGNPDFSDVPASYFAYTFIETGFHAGILSGFDQASCQAAGQLYPCYLPNRPITRGQLTKLVVNAAGYPLFTPTSGQQTFSDVPSTNVFFVSIETAHQKGVINGYPDGTFRPNNNIRRDEMAQIVFKGVITP
jgi:S-layer homology domain